MFDATRAINGFRVTKSLSSYPFSHKILLLTLMELIMQEKYLTKQGDSASPSQKLGSLGVPWVMII